MKKKEMSEVIYTSEVLLSNIDFLLEKEHNNLISTEEAINGILTEMSTGMYDTIIDAATRLRIESEQ